MLYTERSQSPDITSFVILCDILEKANLKGQIGGEGLTRKGQYKGIFWGYATAVS